MVQGSPGDPSGFSPLTPQLVQPAHDCTLCSQRGPSSGYSGMGHLLPQIFFRRSFIPQPANQRARETPKFLRASALDTLRLGIVEGRRQYRKPI